MKNMRYMLAGLLAGIPAVRSVPWPGPVQTVRSGCADGPQIPKPTEGPKIELLVGELKRDLGVPPNTCGWVDGNSDSAWVVNLVSTCLWNSDLSVVNGWTACINYGSTCKGDCSLMNTCNVVSPYCGSVYFPSGYRGFGNCNPAQGMTYNVELTYTGLDQAVDLPIFTGADGISTGTQYPPGETPIAKGTTVVSSKAGTASAASGASTSAVVQLGGGSSGSSSNPSTTLSTPSSHSSVPIGAIVGGVIGGLVIICATVIAIIWLVRSRKKEVQHPPEARFQPGNAGNTGFYPQELEQPNHAVSVSRPELADSKPPFYGEKQQAGYPVGVELPAHS